MCFKGYQRFIRLNTVRKKYARELVKKGLGGLL